MKFIKLEEAQGITSETAFLEALRIAGLEVEIDVSHATRTVLATDNSIYQRRPAAAIFPRNAADVERIARLLAEERFRRVVVSPRGGGTGTNGQSLTDGIVVDLSRHMNRVIEIDLIKRTARVQAGVVKDQLNAALKPHGLFFAPELSTSNRATIGGMISTDASGQGSCTYGKTRDHVIALETVLLGGVPLVSEPVDDAALDQLCARTDVVGRVYKTAREISDSQAELIRDTFPPLNRCLTGYDLAHLREHDGKLNLNSLICGAEGTLGFVVEATLNVLPIPLHSALVNVQYEGFMDALRDARALMEHQPLSIETVDSTVLALARDDVVWASISEFFPDYNEERSTQGINLIEFSADDLVQLQTRIAEFVEHISTDQSVRRLGHTIAWGDVAISRVYAMRKRAVGLLGNVRERRRPQPFVEDTAVPPEQLAYMLWLYLTWLPAYLERERHLSLAITGWLVSIPYLFGTIGMLSSGFAADPLQARGIAPVRSRKWPICVGLIGGAVFTVPAAFTPNLTLAILYLSVAMFFVQMACGASWALVSVGAPRHMAASLASIQNFGGSFAPFVTGVVVDRTHSFVDAFLISAGIALLAALIYALVVGKRVDEPKVAVSKTTLAT